ncbi:MAG: TolC family protein, partial [Planctomycetota bacterium]
MPAGHSTLAATKTWGTARLQEEDPNYLSVRPVSTVNAGVQELIPPPKKSGISELQLPENWSGNIPEKVEPIEAEAVPALHPENDLLKEKGLEHYSGLDPLSLDEVVFTALNRLQVLRSLDAVVLNNPRAVGSSYDPSIQNTNPIIGYEAALSAFDPTLSSSILYSKNDDVFNNPVLGSGANEIRDDVTNMETGWNRIARNGTAFSLRSNIRNSDSNNPSLLFQDSWTSELEGTIRQPLLQGRGRVNQILGPNALPDLPNNRGILLALRDTQIATADFKIAVREMLLEVITNYWELKLAYDRLAASIAVRSLAWETWQAARARYEQGLPGGAADEEAFARAQYYRFTAQVNADIQGSSNDGRVGVLQAEANLRRLIGMDEESHLLLHPTDEPFTAPIRFDVRSLEAQAISSRLEIQQQRTRIEQVQLEILGLQNLQRPRLDLLMTLRSNGFGDSLGGDGPRFTSAFQDAFSGDHFESEFGMSYEIPVRFRQARAAVQNARLRLAREKAVLSEQQKQIRFQVQRSLQALYRHQDDLGFQRERMQAASTATNARLAAFETGVISIDELLLVQQQLLEAKTAYYNTILQIQRSRV